MTALRVTSVKLQAGIASTPKLRAVKLSLAGTAAPVVIPNPNVTSEPEVILTLNASLVGGGGASSWTWRVVSGTAPTAGLSPAGASCSFRVPSVMPPASGTLVIGVTATVASVTSAEVFTTVSLLPQTIWSRVPGGGWVGASRTS